MEANLVWGIFGFIMIMLFRLNWDRNTVLDQKNFSHLGRNVIVFVLLCPVYYAFGLSLNINIWLACLISAGMVNAWWWNLFDPIFNKIRGLKSGWLGSEQGKKGAWTDKVLRKLTLTQRRFLKWGVLIVFTGLYLIIAL